MITTIQILLGLTFSFVMRDEKFFAGFTIVLAFVLTIVESYNQHKKDKERK
jgi:hypothetical protein